jgi:tetratricopeptide (TPR) repeat protein
LEADELTRTLAAPTLGKTYEVDEPYFRLLVPEYATFVERSDACAAVEGALVDPRTAVTSLTGIGGVGKTALATWATLRAYEAKRFEFIVSITAKDRELTSTGLRALTPSLTSFEALLDGIADVLGFPELKQLPADERDREVRSLLKGLNGLLYVDNLETVDDARLITFLDQLPIGVRAIVTSRRPKVRVSVFPVDVGPLSAAEVADYIDSLEVLPELAYTRSLSNPERSRIGTACDGIPLAIRWALSRARTSSDAVQEAERITESGRHGEELLEFCFRRVFDSLTPEEHSVLHVLSLFQRPITSEAIIAGSDHADYKLLDAIDSLVSESIVQRLFDPDRNDYAFTLLPMTRTFVYADVARQQDLEGQIRRKLSDWFEARDVRDPSEREVIRELRQGKGGSESGLVDLAIAAGRRGDVRSAQDLFEQALRRNPRSFRGAREYAEFQRHTLGNDAEALRLYEQAAANAPARGTERALIFREWGMLLRRSGDPQATDLAIEKFEIARVETPNDPVLVHALADALQRKGQHGVVIRLLEPFVATSPKSAWQAKTFKMCCASLVKSYRAQGDLLKEANAKRALIDVDEEFPDA